MSQNVQNSGEEKDAELRSAASPKYNKTGTDVVSGTAHMSNMTRDERQPTSSAITDSVIDLVDWTNPNNFTQTVQIPAADLQNLQSLQNFINSQIDQDFFSNYEQSGKSN